MEEYSVEAYFTGINIIVDAVKFYSETNPNIRYRIYNNDSIFINRLTSIIFVGIDNGAWIIRILNDPVMIDRCADLNDDFCEYCITNKIFNFISYYNCHDRILDRIYYLLNISDNYVNIILNSRNCAREFIIKMNQCFIRSLENKLFKNNILFKLSLHDVSVILELHPDFDLWDGDSYQLRLFRTVIEINTIDGWCIGSFNYEQLILEPLINTIFYFTHRCNTILSLVDCSKKRLQSLIKFLNPVAIYWKLNLELIPDITKIIIKKYLELCYNSWDFVFKKKLNN